MKLSRRIVLPWIGLSTISTAGSLVWPRSHPLTPAGVRSRNHHFDVSTVNSDGVVIETQSLKTREFSELLDESFAGTLLLQMVSIPGGTFLMGSNESEEGRWDDENYQHKVSVKSFFMSKYPITQRQWMTVANYPKVDRDLRSIPSSFVEQYEDYSGKARKRIIEDRPVENISWYDAVEFCSRLSQHTGRDYRLPSEAEWEYACRGGTTTPFHFGETITTELANYRGTDWKSESGNTSLGFYGEGPRGEYKRETTEVGRFEIANPYGLYDMHGNVWEWCADHSHENYEGAPTDGSPWLSSDEDDRRVMRGGAWYTSPRSCRSASRLIRVDPNSISSSYGFRVVWKSPLELAIPPA